MLALRMRQKDSEFYFVSYRAEDLLSRVRFETRFYGERGEVVGGDTADDEADAAEVDAVERYVRAIERSSGAFQRELNRRKVRQIRDFFRNETDQPVVPGAVLLFTPEQLKFTPIGQYEQLGDLALPRAPFLIIDGQHRLAGLHFYLREPEQHRDRVGVPREGAADAHPAPMRLCPHHRPLDEPQDGRVQRVHMGRQARIRAVHRQRILCQVVRPNREEVRLTSEFVRDERRRRRLDHDPDRDRRNT